MALIREADLAGAREIEPDNEPAVDVRLVGFRYHPALGGAEQHSRRLLQELGPRLSVDVVTVLTENRSDWIRALIGGARDREERYEVDGRLVRALARWPVKVRRRLTLLSPLYHLPSSPAPGLMGRLLAPELAPVVRGTRLIHNVFMGREAFSLGLMLATHRLGEKFLFVPLAHQRPLGWNSPAFRQLYRESDRVIALTQHEADWLARQGAPRERLRVIGIGPLSDPSASPAAARQLLGDRKLVLFLGQLHDYKGYRQLLEAAARLSDRDDLLFVFAGPDVRHHARRFKDAPANVRYLGRIDDDLRNSLLQACTVLCVPSSRESFGGVIVDAWACGKPVIGGPAPATRELVEPDRNGVLVEQDPAAIGAAVVRIVDDQALARGMGAEGRAKVEAHFSWSAIARDYLEVYTELGVRPR